MKRKELKEKTAAVKGRDKRRITDDIRCAQSWTAEENRC